MKGQDENAIYCSSSCGPIFGDGHDICICDNSNTTASRYSNLGNTYKHPDYEYGSNEAESFLAGSYIFRIVEMDVYTKL